MSKLIDLALEVRCEMHTLKEFFKRDSKRISERLDEEWIDSQQAMSVLKIKKRALQKLRDDGSLPFSPVHGKLYYKISDVEKLLISNYMKRGDREMAPDKLKDGEYNPKTVP